MKKAKSNYKKQLVGYFALRKGTAYLLCDGQDLVVAGSQKDLVNYIEKLAGQSASDYQIKKTFYAEVIAGMQMGGSYAFDTKAYELFLPLLQAQGKSIVEFKPEDDTPPFDGAIRLIRIAWVDIT